MRMIRRIERIDLLVTDVGLPGGMNGRQIAEAARRRHASLKVLYITGYAQSSAVRAEHLEPGIRMLTKPFTLESLLSSVREVIAL
jgi:DNA-binding response OmpR family regulator